jgi:hypothetical protein
MRDRHEQVVVIKEKMDTGSLDVTAFWIVSTKRRIRIRISKTSTSLVNGWIRSGILKYIMLRDWNTLNSRQGEINAN